MLTSFQILESKDEVSFLKYYFFDHFFLKKNYGFDETSLYIYIFFRSHKKKIVSTNMTEPILQKLSHYDSKFT